MTRAALIALFLVFVAAAAAPAQSFRAGLSAYNIGDYAAAMREWRPLAEDNLAKAQSGVGFLYYKGLGVPQDSVRAAAWFTRAAEQGEPGAQMFLALMRFFGDGLPRDLVRALMWSELALSAGEEAALEWRDRIMREMTAAERDAGWRLAAEWYERRDKQDKQ